jgi:putative phosphoribosyl transferase
MANLFQDRTEAGQALAARMKYFVNRIGVLVLAISRGGVPVASEVARELRAPLDVFLVRQLNVGGNDELAMGAVASGGVVVMNERVIGLLNISEDAINTSAAKEGEELERQERIYRDDRMAINPREKVIILIDDGLATGTCMRAAVAALRELQPAGIVAALPVAAPEICAELETEVEQMICLETPEPVFAVGLYYRHFPRVTDEEVRDLLRQSAEDLAPADGHAHRNTAGD